MDSDEGEELGAYQYQKKLRERANRSIQQLSSALAERSSDVEDEEARRGRNSPSSPRGEKQSEAVNQLKSLLQKQQRASSPLPPSKRSPKRASEETTPSLPAVQDLVPIHNQSEYIQHLEAEVKFCKDELVGMKQRIRVVVVENEKLQGELKSKMVEETLKDYTLLDATLTEPPAAGLPTPPSGPAGLRAAFSSSSGWPDHAHWKRELEQLKVLYQAQTDTLEAQVTSLRKELATSQRECEEVKGRLRHKEAVASASVSGAQRVGGLCLKCAQHEAVLAETHSNIHIQAIDRLTKERDELLAVLCSVRAGQSEAQQREWSAYQQVKQAVVMAEEAKLDRERVEVQCEQLAREVTRQRERLEEELSAHQQRLCEARDQARSDVRQEKEELATTVVTLSQRVAELEGQMDRGDRERGSLTSQLDEALRKLTIQEQDSSKTSGELRYQMSQAQLRREEAERELRDTTSRTSRQVELASQEVERLGQELIGCRQRLEAAQREAGQSQAEVLSLTEQLGQAQHQLHLTRQEREVWERCRGEDMAAVTLSAQRREQELTLRLQQAETQHGRYAAELDGLLSSQNTLIGKLKEECCMLGAKLEELTEASRSEVEQLSLEKHYLEETVEKLRARCTTMEEQCVQHGRLHQRMKNRLQLLDQHCQSSAQQVLELLARQNQLTQERHVLTEEMQNLRIQLPGAKS